MIKKLITPIIEQINKNGDMIVVGTKVEYRLLGILLYKKEFYNPEKYGVYRYNNYQICI